MILLGKRFFFRNWKKEGLKASSREKNTVSNYYEEKEIAVETNLSYMLVTMSQITKMHIYFSKRKETPHPSGHTYLNVPWLLSIVHTYYNMYTSDHIDVFSSMKLIKLVTSKFNFSLITTYFTFSIFIRKSFCLEIKIMT